MLNSSKTMPVLDFSPVSSATPIVGVAMSSAIGFREFSEDDYRNLSERFQTEN